MLNIISEKKFSAKANVKVNFISEQIFVRQSLSLASKSG
jgi:hypothetical protein